MDNEKIGNLIAMKRREMKMTQKQLGLKLNVTDKTISKWELGLGLPDISFIEKLAEILEINVNEVLSGDVKINDNDMANMKKTKLYFCPKCGNIVASTNDLVINCCGSRLTELSVSEDCDVSREDIKIQYVEDDIFVTVDHDMEKSHFISFIAYVTCDKLTINKLYPEQEACARFKRYGHGIIYALCNKHGMISVRI